VCVCVCVTYFVDLTPVMSFLLNKATENCGHDFVKVMTREQR